ncbi:unnamed protein product [Mytilus edulis]|uniref:Ankyrin repeat protein n=1 Tax=Mytilus edulis TaxID=6550 RepID=A0A8S3PZL1_MYTED|nr:unnamed protein product [Mytilus edulis]
MIEACKAGFHKTAEVMISEVDMNKVDVTSIITAMLSSIHNNKSKDLFIFLIQNIDKTCCRWIEIITIIVELKLYSYIELILQHVDNTKIDMMKIVRNKMNVLSENELKVLILSIKRELIDINYIAWAAFKIGYHEIVIWSIMNDNQKVIDKSELFYKAIFNCNTNVMHYLLENVDHGLLDIETAVDVACRRGKYNMVKMLLLNVEDKEIDVSSNR